MARWWKKTAWPWFKENWWAVLIAPLAILVLGGMLVARLFGRGPDVPDPFREADERALEEQRTRARVLEAEKERLTRRVEQLEDQTHQLQEALEEALGGRVEDLREDPQRLKDLMVRVGPGEEP